MDKKALLQSYLEYKKLTVKSRTKLEDLERYVQRFLKSYNHSIDKTSEKDLIKFFNSISSYSPHMLNDIKVYLKNFIKWHFPDYSSRFRNLDKICKTEKPPATYSSEQMLSVEDVEKLVKNETSPFWKAYFLVLFYGGMRPIEANKIQWRDVTFDKEGGAFIRVYSKKNRREFEKYVPENVVFYLKKIRTHDSEWVFPSSLREGRPISNKTSYFRLTKLSKRVLNKNVNPYILRHSLATLLYNKEGLKDEDAARQLGHSESMKTIYSHLSKEKLRERSKKIWIEGEDLPPEKKHELEKRIELLEKALFQNFTKVDESGTVKQYAFKNRRTGQILKNMAEVEDYMSRD